VSDSDVHVQLGFNLFPAEVALPDGRVYERVLVSVTGVEVSVGMPRLRPKWQAAVPGGDVADGSVLIWSGTWADAERERPGCPPPGTFTIPTVEGPLEVTWPRLLTTSPGGEDR